MSPTSDKPTLAGQFVDLRALTPDDAVLRFAWRQGVRAILLNQGARFGTYAGYWIRAFVLRFLLTNFRLPHQTS